MENGTSGPRARAKRLRKGLLPNREIRSYRPHTDSETKILTVESGCGYTAVLVGLDAGVLQGPVSAWRGPLRLTRTGRQI